MIKAEINDSELRELFLKIYDDCNSACALMNSSPRGMLARTEHFENHYDFIQIDHMWSDVTQYVMERYPDSNHDVQVLVDEVVVTYIKAILPHEIPRIISVVLLSFVHGMVNTVSKAHIVFYVYSLVAWIGFWVLLTWGINKRGLDSINRLGMLTLASCVLNVAVVAAVIFTQTRYMIYNMPLFYVTGFLMLDKFVESAGSNNKTKLPIP